MNSDPIYQGPDGNWWFWDETWSFRHGPYNTEQLAREACIEHAKNLDIVLGRKPNETT